MMNDNINDVLLKEDIERLEADSVEIESIEKTTEQNAQASEEQKELSLAISTILGAGFDTICPAWKVQADEIEKLSECYACLVDKYFPDWATRFGLEINAILLTAIVVLPRLKTPRKEKKADNDDEK